MKVVIFDIGGVLCSDTYNELIDSHYKGTEEHKDIKKAAVKAWEQYKIGKLTEDEFWLQIINNSSMKLTVEYLKETTRKNLVGHTQTFEVVKELVEAKIELGILSNHADEWIEYIFKTYSDIPKYFPKDLTFISSEIGLVKPDLKCYEYVHEKIQKKFPEIQKGDVIFIDDKEANIKAAQSIGWQGIVYNAKYDSADDLRNKLNPLLK